ncbi:hypothetical protein Hanom_Chr09g00791571 [Helianthus anomalus]
MVKGSVRTRRLLDILRLYEAAESLLLLASSPPLMAKEKEPAIPDSSTIVGSARKVFQEEGVVDEEVGMLSVERLMSRFLMIQRGGCQLVYPRRKKRDDSGGRC